MYGIATAALVLTTLGAVPAQARELPPGPPVSNTGGAGSAPASVPITSIGDPASAHSAGGLYPASEPTLLVAESSPAQSTSQTAPPKQKSMAATVLLWLVVPGGGNFYSGAIGKGFIELGGSVGGLALMVTSLRDQCKTIGRVTFCDEEISQGQFWGGFGALMGFRIWGLISAINRTQDINSGKISPFERLRLTIPTKKEGFKLLYSHSF